MDTTITFLQMFERPVRSLMPPPREGLSIVHARRPTVSFYRFLYETVGGPWQWVDRCKLSDAELAALVQAPTLEVNVLYVDGVPAGYAELDFGKLPEDVELAYFGIMPEFIGQRLGPYLLDWAIDRAWQRQPRRLWLHTCTDDHPAALPTYRKLGFQPYAQKIVSHP